MASPVSKSEKENQKKKLVQEKCQTILAGMLRDEDNKYCVDCDAKGPRWASWNLGIFLCIRCAGIHRNLGVHISRVKSVNLDSWTPEQVVSLQQMGNSRARAVYEANLPDSFRRPQTDSTLESFIRAKYEAKRYIAKEWVCPPPVKVSWDAEIEMELKRKKESKAKTNGSSPFPVELPNPSSSRSRPSEATPISSGSSASAKEPAPVEQPLPAPTKTSSAAQDLLGLDTVINSSGSNDLFGGLLNSNATTSAGSGTSAPTAGGPPKNSEEDSFFNQKAPSTTEKRTLDKNSILALYNQGGSTISSNIVPPMQNVFASQGFTSTQPAFTAAPQMNQPTNMMGANFNPMMQGNMFSSPIYPTNGAMQAGAAQIGQVSQQLSGLNFGPPVHNPMMPSSTPSYVPGMMMNNATVPMAMNPGMVATNANPYMFMASTGIQSAPQQQPQHASTLSSNLWQ